MTSVLSAPIPRITEPRPTQSNAPSHGPPDVRYVPASALVHYLGCLSIGLGMLEIFAPRTLAQLTGVRQVTLLQVYGVREVICGVGILTCSRPTGWLWARVGGDLLDLATAAANYPDADDDRRTRLMATAAALAGVTALDVVCASGLSAADALADD